MRLSISMLCVSAMLAAAPVVAEPAAPPQREPSGTDLAREGLNKLMLGLQQLVEELPRYGLPEITENGDIIIRRIDPGRAKEAPRIPADPGDPADGIEL
ncbi:hypothetical protein IGS68_18285 [Skermanella sp. TT6]|uniref:AAA+ family ATPase n=1 Tax=Skermanella cutis TaxID=2775420 RepID=A0ABX7B693_9PROT|nr:hypothetical protein [Skermanella sp. TT6]QQP88006.1 hypothetical protein IGS68_18285 [Skermanella sp. TT6]